MASGDFDYDESTDEYTFYDRDGVTPRYRLKHLDGGAGRERTLG